MDWHLDTIQTCMTLLWFLPIYLFRTISHFAPGLLAQITPNNIDFLDCALLVFPPFFLNLLFSLASITCPFLSALTINNHISRQKWNVNFIVTHSWPLQDELKAFFSVPCASFYMVFITFLSIFVFMVINLKLHSLKKGRSLMVISLNSYT